MCGASRQPGRPQPGRLVRMVLEAGPLVRRRSRGGHAAEVAKDITMRKNMLTSIRNRAASVLACLLIQPVFSACDRSATVDVNLHGVNYTVDTFSFSVRDPARKDQPGAGGELIDPYGAGGTTCCVTLPKTWRPGIKLQVNATHWVDRRPDNGLLEVKETQLVEVPHYPDGKPGELWVLRMPDGKVAVVSSDFQPDHPSWPGKIKGWPVPSLAYRHERWKIIFRHELGGIDDSLSLLDELENDPQGAAKRAWELAEQYDRESIKRFSGSGDPDYIVQLKKRYEASLEYSRGRVLQVMEEKP